MPSTDKKSGATEGDERLRSTIRERLRILGISAREASRRAGFNVGYVGDILDGRSKTPEANRILRLADALDFDATDFLADSAVAETARSPEPFDYLAADRPLRPAMVPLYAAPLPTASPFVNFGESPIGQVAPLPIPGVPGGGYALVVPNNVNEPRYFTGETIHVRAGVTPKEGEYVVVTMKDGTRAIGCLGEVCPESFTIRFAGLGPRENEAILKFADVESVHRIAGVLH